ncbi:hypothetical protein [Muricoccus radiodurans]|uniref:hypothetical protein n=1 Tax=Muricoccus radiodurans TaxID=2231721 RepID=UPI003CF05B2A
MAVRKSGPPPPGQTSVFHAVTPNCRMALCATEPGAGSEWADPAGTQVTCRACLRRLSRIGGRPAAQTAATG